MFLLSSKAAGPNWGENWGNYLVHTDEKSLFEKIIVILASPPQLNHQGVREKLGEKLPVYKNTSTVKSKSGAKLTEIEGILQKLEMMFISNTDVSKNDSLKECYKVLKNCQQAFLDILALEFDIMT